jgi:hypothetical protein
MWRLATGFGVVKNAAGIEGEQRVVDVWTMVKENEGLLNSV